MSHFLKTQILLPLGSISICFPFLSQMLIFLKLIVSPPPQFYDLTDSCSTKKERDNWHSWIVLRNKGHTPTYFAHFLLIALNECRLLRSYRSHSHECRSQTHPINVSWLLNLQHPALFQMFAGASHKRHAVFKTEMVRVDQRRGLSFVINSTLESLILQTD